MPPQGPKPEGVERGGKTRSTAPLATALRGMSGYCADASSCANVTPPAALTSPMPSAVRTGSREDDAGGIRALHRGEGPQEMVDRIVRLSSVGPSRDGQDAVGDRDLRVGLNDIHVVRPDFLTVHCVNDPKRRVGLKDARQLGLVVRIEMLDDHHRKA